MFVNIMDHKKVKGEFLPFAVVHCCDPALMPCIYLYNYTPHVLVM